MKHPALVIDSLGRVSRSIKKTLGELEKESDDVSVRGMIDYLSSVETELDSAIYAIEQSATALCEQ